MDCNSLLSYQLYFLLKTEHFTYYNVVTVKIRFSSPSPQVLLLYFMIYKSSIFKLFKLFFTKTVFFWCMCSQKSLFHYLSVISVRQCTDIFLYFLLNLFKLKLQKTVHSFSHLLPVPVSCNRQSVLFIWIWYFRVLFLDSTLSCRHYSLFSKYSSKLLMYN